jgi:hypothetical protein
MSTSNSFYVLKLLVGGEDLTQHLKRVTIKTNKIAAIQIIELILTLNREQYDKYVVDYKDKLRLDVTSSTGFKNDDTPPNVDASFSYDLTVLQEPNQQSNIKGAGNASPGTALSLICIGRDALKNRQKFIKNKVFINKNREQILNDVFTGSDIEIQSDIFKPSDIIEQFVLPPSRQISAFEYLDYRLNLFKDAKPSYVTYSLDGTIYVGSCIKNNMEPLRLFYGTEDSQIETMINTSSKTDDVYDYLITKPMTEECYYNVVCLGLGKNQSYCFSPLNKLYSRLEINLNEFQNNLLLHNNYGDDPRLGKHVKNTNIKESWFRGHNGIDEVNTPDDNKFYSENYVSEHANQALGLSMEIESVMKLEDLFYIGRQVKLTSGLNAKRFDGYYYLESSDMTFTHDGVYWNGRGSMTIKSSIDVSNA